MGEALENGAKCRSCVVAEGFSMVSTISVGVSDVEPTVSGPPGGRDLYPRVGGDDGARAGFPSRSSAAVGTSRPDIGFAGTGAESHAPICASRSLGGKWELRDLPETGAYGIEIPAAPARIVARNAPMRPLARSNDGARSGCPDTGGERASS